MMTKTMTSNDYSKECFSSEPIATIFANGEVVISELLGNEEYDELAEAIANEGDVQDALASIYGDSVEEVIVLDGDDAEAYRVYFLI